MAAIAAARNDRGAYKQERQDANKKAKGERVSANSGGHRRLSERAMEEWDDDPRLLVRAFRNIDEARGGVSELAWRAKLDRVVLSRALSGRRNPRLETLAREVSVRSVKLRFET